MLCVQEQVVAMFTTEALKVVLSQRGHQSAGNIYKKCSVV